MIKIDPKKYMTIFLGALILTALVGATGATLLNNIAGTNNGTDYVGGLGGVGGAFESTGLASLFGVAILGLLFAVFIFYALYRMFSGK